jgi:hypothetical protein
VQGNGFKDNGAMAIARAMREMVSNNLVKLDMGFNEIEDDGAFTISNVRLAFASF